MANNNNIVTHRRVTALVISKEFDISEAGLVWIPSTCQKYQYQNGLQNYNLGDWLFIDAASKNIVDINRREFVSTAYQTCLHITQGSEYTQVRVPIVFFSGTSLPQKAAFSPMFGPINFGKYKPPADLRVDTLYYAWIVYMHPDIEAAKEWLVLKLETPLNTRHLTLEVGAGHYLFNTGIVVNRHESNSLVEAGNTNEPKLEMTTVDIWTADLSENVPGICTHMIAKSLESGTPKFEIGTICRFVTMRNFSGTHSAVSPFELENPQTGIVVTQKRPTLKIRIGGERWYFNLNASQIVVPQFVGLIGCQQIFQDNLRHIRPDQHPYITIEFNGLIWETTCVEYCSGPKPHQVPAFSDGL